MQKNNFDYNEISDSLIISRKQEGEQVQGSAEIGDLILDFTSSGKIVNIEFQNISSFLEIMNINPDILNQLTEVNLIVKEQKGAVSLFAILKTPTTHHPISLATVPITQPLASSI